MLLLAVSGNINKPTELSLQDDLCPEALSQALGDDKWLARINPPHKEQTLHCQLLTNTKVSNPTAKNFFGFGVTATASYEAILS